MLAVSTKGEVKQHNVSHGKPIKTSLAEEQIFTLGNIIPFHVVAQVSCGIDYRERRLTKQRSGIVLSPV